MSKYRRPEPTDALGSLRRIIRSGQPVPLAWIVKHGNEFESAWTAGWATEPAKMMEIASSVSPRETVNAAIALARKVLSYTNDDPRVIRVIQAAERVFDENEITYAVERVHELAAYLEDQNKSAADAASAAAAAATARLQTEPEEISYHAAIAAYHYGQARSEAGYTGPTFVPIHLTVADIVRAGKNGWKPV